MRSGLEEVLGLGLVEVQGLRLELGAQGVLAAVEAAEATSIATEARHAGGGSNRGTDARTSRL